VSCAKLYEKDTAVFIKEKFLEAGKQIDYEAVMKLIDENGLDLASLENEIEKLILFAGENRKITAGDIDFVGGRTKEANLYSLSGFIESKDKSSALTVVEKLLENGEPEVMIMAAITQCIRRMLIAKSMQDELNENPTQVLPPNMVWKLGRPFTMALSMRSLESLETDMRHILETDLALKTSSGKDSFSLIEDLIISLCRGRA
jgi:DNA polymerase-3 subunit delta